MATKTQTATPSITRVTEELLVPSEDYKNVSISSKGDQDASEGPVEAQSSHIKVSLGISSSWETWSCQWQISRDQ
jgi:hypothetical protein